MSPKINFIKTALKDYKVAAITPSSKYVVRRILKQIRPEYKFIVEYGAGDGVITKEILGMMPADGKLIAVELNRDFIEILKRINDSRLQVVGVDVRDFSARISDFGLPRVDAVISGIPFSFLSHKDRRDIIWNTHSFLDKKGVFIVYQTSFLICPYLKYVFRNRIEIQFEPRNFPPYFIMATEK